MKEEFNTRTTNVRNSDNKNNQTLTENLSTIKTRKVLTTGVDSGWGVIFLNC